MPQGRLLTVLAVCLVVLPILTLAAYWNVYDTAQAKAHNQIELGAKLEQVVELAGQPRYTTDGTLWVEPRFARAENDLITGCTKELWYEARLRFIPSKWSYCFNKSDELIQKYHWVSW